MAFLDLWKLAQGADGFSLNKALEENYRLSPEPKYNAMRCHSGRREADPCTLCSQVCPKGIYPPDKKRLPNFSGCLECGLCAAVCPDRCIALPLRRAADYMKQVTRNSALEASCHRSDSPSDLKLNCLAALSSDQLALAALKGTLTLDVSHCAQCPDTQLRQRLEKNLEDCRAFLGDDVFRQRISTETRPAGGGSGVSRRELFTSFLEMDVDRAFNAMPALEARQDNGLLIRAMLRDTIRSNAASLPAEQRPKYRVYLPVFTDHCHLCGSCEWKCPQKALKLEQQGDSILATIDVWRCTDCGICQSVCKVGGISGIAPMKVTTLGRTALKRIPAWLCQDCGKPRPKDAPEGVCGHCLGQRKVQRLRQQRQLERMENKDKQEQL